MFISDFRGPFQDAMTEIQPLGIFFQPKKNFSSCGRAVDAVVHQCRDANMKNQMLQVMK